ncbi:MAG TPA: peptidyl-prolyl cis-trans isomerase [Pirellulales bacterium]|nr:peptidyl-prolyl cis-trans isomerase [Pirellulales bacterium]
MERTLFSVLSIITLGLAFTAWAEPSATEELFKLIGVRNASAQAPVTPASPSVPGGYDPTLDPKRDPFNMLPNPIMPTAPTSPQRPASWPGSAPDYFQKYGFTQIASGEHRAAAAPSANLDVSNLAFGAAAPNALPLNAPALQVPTFNSAAGHSQAAFTAPATVPGQVNQVIFNQGTNQLANAPLFGPPPIEGGGNPPPTPFPTQPQPHPQPQVPPFAGIAPGAVSPSNVAPPSNVAAPSNGPPPSNVAPYAPPAAPYVAPGAASPPESYAAPAANAPVNATAVNPAPAQAMLPQPAQVFEAGQILARVGSDVILAGDVLPVADERLAAYADKMTPEQIEQQRKLLVQTLVKQLIETKMICADARRTIPAANFPKVEESLTKEFNKTRIKELMKQYKAESNPELDEKLRVFGSSIEKQKKTYIERMIALSWMQQTLKSEDDIRRDELLAYYHEHHADYEFPAKARWEEISARFDKFPSKADAYRAVAGWGNDVLRGVPWSDVAKAHSQDANASDGGRHDWTSQGSLVSDALDKALFSLPVGGLSQIIEDQDGFHIIRVVGRKLAGVTPFEETQLEIKKKIKADRRDGQIKEYMAKLKEKTPIVTVWDSGAADEPQLTSRPENAPR